MDVSAQLAHPKRLKQLEIRRILDTPADEIFDRIARLVAQSINAPVALVTFVDDHRQWFKSSYGLGEPWKTRRETPLSHSFCQYVVAFKRPLVVPDAREDPLVKENLAIPDLNVIAYLGVPLIDVDGSALGSLAVADSQPHAWTARDIQAMTDFAAITMIEVQLRTEVAQRAEVEEQLRQAQKLEAIGKLAGGVAHDFNNILLIVQGYASLLAEHVANSPDATQQVQEIKKAADRASTLTQQLLAFGRRQPLQPQMVSVNDVVMGFESMLRRTLSEDLELAFELDAQIDLVEVDPAQLEQVLLNLVINARDASVGGGRIVIRTLRHAQALPSSVAAASAHGWTELQVQDFGAGIEAAILPQIFEPFFTTKQLGKGVGLGLATVHGIVNQSGGIVFAESTLGQGSTFRVLLPRVARAANEAAVATTARVTALPRGSAHATILLVEDDLGARNLLTSILQRTGYDVIAAGNGAEALRSVDQRQQTIDLAILDVVMPGMNGRVLGEQMRVRYPNLTILHMSGYADDRVLQNGIASGNVNFLPKPSTPEELLAKVASLLQPGITLPAAS